MWTDEKQRLFDSLREKELAGTLAAVEQQQLEQFLAELDAEETELLRPAMERMEQEHQQKLTEIAKLQKKKSLLAALVAQEDQLLHRARTALQELRSEQARLRHEYERALAEDARAA